MSERLITARELAEQLGCSTGALLRWTRAGQLPGVKLPSGGVRFRPEEIETWLTERSTGDATRGVSPTRNATRRMEVSSVASPIPLRDVAAPTEEEPQDAC